MGTSFTRHIVDIAGRRTYPGTIVCEGAPYYLPGLTDAHVHIESSMMTPANFAKVAVLIKTEQLFGEMQIYEKFSLDNCRDRCIFGLEKCRTSCWKEKYRITLSIFMR